LGATVVDTIGMARWRVGALMILCGLVLIVAPLAQMGARP
jgi:hypothetical protein